MAVTALSVAISCSRTPLPRFPALTCHYTGGNDHYQGFQPPPRYIYIYMKHVRKRKIAKKSRVGKRGRKVKDGDIDSILEFFLSLSPRSYAFLSHAHTHSLRPTIGISHGWDKMAAGRPLLRGLAWVYVS